jgi:hypothetical protein
MGLLEETKESLSDSWNGNPDGNTKAQAAEWDGLFGYGDLKDAKESLLFDGKGYSSLYPKAPPGAYKGNLGNHIGTVLGGLVGSLPFMSLAPEGGIAKTAALGSLAGGWISELF